MEGEAVGRAADGDVDERAEGRMEGEAVVEGFIVVDGSIDGTVVSHSTNFGECFPSVELK